MHLRRIYVQIPQMDPNLIFSCNRKDFGPLVPILQSINSGGVEREIASEDGGKKVVEYFSLLLVCRSACQPCSSKGYALFDLPFHTDRPVEDHLIENQVPMQWYLVSNMSSFWATADASECTFFLCHKDSSA